MSEPILLTEETPIEVFLEEPVEITEEPEELILEQPVEVPVTKEVIEGRKQQRVKQLHSIDADVKIESDDVLALPDNYEKEVVAALEKAPNISLVDSPNARDWAETLRDGQDILSFKETFVPSLERDDAEFSNGVAINGGELSGQYAKHKQIANENIKGQRAVLRIMSHMGLGSPFQTPLWHSGIWLTFKPPSEAEIIELNRLLVKDKIQLGRSTYGIAFSNTSSFVIARLMDFAVAHIYDMSAKSDHITLNNIKEHISCQDIPSLLWGFICSIYPRGFKYKRACSNNPDKCDYILTDTLNISKLQWTDNHSLTDWQKTMMTMRQSKNTSFDNIVRYKEELLATQKRTIVLNKGLSNEIKITLKSPSVAEYIDAGYKWLKDITTTVENTLGGTEDMNERNALITKYGQSSAMRQYAHWVESIEYSTNIINDPETLDITLDILSSDDVIRNTFTDDVVKYINDSTISVIGVPVYDCPKCGEVQTSSHQMTEFVNIIPLDCVNVFFILLEKKLARLLER